MHDRIKAWRDNHYSSFIPVLAPRGGARIMTVAPNVVLAKIAKALHLTKHPTGCVCRACEYDSFGKDPEGFTRDMGHVLKADDDFDFDDAETHELYRWADDQLQRGWLTERELVILVNGKINPDMTYEEVQTIWREVLRTTEYA